MAHRWSGILNRTRVIDHGNSALREAAVDVMEHGIRAADPYPATLNLLQLDGDVLSVGALKYDLRQWNNLYVIGAGKATQPIAQALEAVLGDRISDGLVILKRGEPSHLRHIRVLEAAHPIPDSESYRGAQEMVKMARQAGERDMVFAAITGGSSALMIWPAEDILLEDMQALNRLLLNCGADIREINAVRKHVSRIKGGQLALDIFPAKLINLTVSDVVGDPLDYITDPTVPDRSNYADAWRTLDKYDLWKCIPSSIRQHLERGPRIETPKSFAHSPHTFVVVPGDAAGRGAARRSEELGFGTRILSTELEGESHEQAAAFVAVAENISSVESVERRVAVIACGETNVTLHATHIEGDPNQEFALAAALAINGRNDVVVGAIDVDGTDGPTEVSGGLVDGGTVARAAAAGLDAAESLRRHAASTLLDATGDLVITGPTGTNVSDLMIFLASH